MKCIKNRSAMTISSHFIENFMYFFFVWLSIVNDFSSERWNFIVFYFFLFQNRKQRLLHSNRYSYSLHCVKIVLSSLYCSLNYLVNVDYLFIAGLHSHFILVLSVHRYCIWDQTCIPTMSYKSIVLLCEDYLKILKIPLHSLELDKHRETGNVYDE